MTSNVSFHQSTVTEFHRRAGAVRLALTDVKTSEGSHAAEIQIDGVTRIIVDGADVEVVGMEHDLGEVLTLDLSNREMYAIVQWNDFVNHTSVTRSYRIEGEHVKFTMSPPIDQAEA
jgi:hypothetical protein